MRAPALSFDAINIVTKVDLEVISDADIYLFLEKGMRDGVSYNSKRYRQANNKYLKSYDPKQDSKHIIYLDANNLYDYAMSKFLPTSGFKWIDPKKFNLNTTAIVQKLVFSKLILNILKNYMNYTMIILELQV